MKKVLLSVWFLCAAFFIFISCSKSTTAESVPAPDAESTNALVGTSWLASHTQMDTIHDTTYIFTFNAALKFTDDTAGVMFSDNRIFINNVPELADKPLRVPFTYTFSESKGKMILDFEKVNTERGFSRFVEITFQFDKKANRITTFAPNNRQLEVYFEMK